jgi:hypothetical protein
LWVFFEEFADFTVAASAIMIFMEPKVDNAQNVDLPTQADFNCVSSVLMLELLV